MLTKTKTESLSDDKAGATKPMTMIQALCSALDVMMERDDNVVVFGQDGCDQLASSPGNTRSE